jgi:hypothetical protein
MVFNNSGSWVLFGFEISNLVGIRGDFGLGSAIFTFGTSSGSLGIGSGSNHPPNSLISTLPFQ